LNDLIQKGLLPEYICGELSTPNHPRVYHCESVTSNLKKGHSAYKNGVDFVVTTGGRPGCAAGNAGPAQIRNAFKWTEMCR